VTRAAGGWEHGSAAGRQGGRRSSKEGYGSPSAGEGRVGGPEAVRSPADARLEVPRDTDTEERRARERAIG
jgi:hypothetical protein